MKDIVKTSQEPEEIDNDATDEVEEYSSVRDVSAELILTILAYIVAVGGLSVSILFGLYLLNNEEEKIGLFFLIGGPMVSLIIGAGILVIVNISKNIRQIIWELRR